MKYLIGSGHEIDKYSNEMLFLYFNEDYFQTISMEMIMFYQYERNGIEPNILLKLLHKTDFKTIRSNPPIYDDYTKSVVDSYLDRIIKKK